jgi:GMP synthase (glutamine-hydrolysing)
VQAAEIEHDRGVFWGVQYHPEWDLHEVARLAELRRDELVTQGSFADAAAAQRWCEDLDALQKDATRDDLARAHAIGPAVLDPALRTREIANWLEHQVRRASR